MYTPQQQERIRSTVDRIVNDRHFSGTRYSIHTVGILDVCTCGHVSVDLDAAAAQEARRLHLASEREKLLALFGLPDDRSDAKD